MTVISLIPPVAEKVNRPFTEKFNETMGMIAHNIGIHKNPVVAWSGGKDSTLVLWLCLKLKPDILTVFNNTGVEYPETVKFVHSVKESWKVNLQETQPDRQYFDIMATGGYETGKREKLNDCCYWLKEKPWELKLRQLMADCEFTGITAVENRMRMFNARDYGACFFSKKSKRQRVHPILWWTENEVKQYHADMGIPLNPMYSKGCDRVGCMPCTAFKGWEKQLGRTNPKLYRLLKLRKDKQYVMDMGSPITPPPSEAVKP